MPRVGAVDIGTNSTRLLVADVVGDEVVELDRRSTVTRLGEGVDAGKLLLPAAIARVHAVLAEYRAVLDAAGVEHTLAVATSAARDAANGPAFLSEIGERFGFETRLLRGEEEAELTRQGVGATGAGTLLVDIGGGSTELILGSFRTSIDVGSVRMTERFLHSDPPTTVELGEARAFVGALLPELEVQAAVGVAGTVTQLYERIGELTVAALDAELALLTSLPQVERAALPRMDPARAPVIVGGALIVVEVLHRYALDVLAWSKRDLLDGVALAAAASG